MGVRSFCLKQFFPDRSVANLMMLTIDECLMLDCFWDEKFCLHYALCDFDSILLHCTKLFIRHSIDRKQILDVTFENPLLKNPANATDLEHYCTVHMYSRARTKKSFAEF